MLGGGMRRDRPRRPRSAAALAPIGLALLLAVVNCARVGVATPAGVQCPTAPVQTVVSLVRGANGALVRVARPPRPGEPGFVQCRCQERHAAKSWNLSAPGACIAFLTDAPKLAFPAPPAPLTALGLGWTATAAPKRTDTRPPVA